MRSNIARTWPSGRVPLRAVPTPPREDSAIELPQRAEEGDELVELGRVLLAQARERRHRSRRVDERARDRRPRQPRTDLGEVRPRPGVAVLTDLVAGQAAGGGGHVLALLIL